MNNEQIRTQEWSNYRVSDSRKYKKHIRRTRVSADGEKKISTIEIPVDLWEGKRKPIDNKGKKHGIERGFTKVGMINGKPLYTMNQDDIEILLPNKLQ